MNFADKAGPYIVAHGRGTIKYVMIPISITIYSNMNGRFGRDHYTNGYQLALITVKLLSLKMMKEAIIVASINAKTFTSEVNF